MPHCPCVIKPSNPFVRTFSPCIQNIPSFLIWSSSEESGHENPATWKFGQSLWPALLGRSAGVFRKHKKKSIWRKQLSATSTSLLLSHIVAMAVYPKPAVPLLYLTYPMWYTSSPRWHVWRLRSVVSHWSLRERLFCQLGQGEILRRQLQKVRGPNLVSYLNWTPIFEWCVDSRINI